MNTPAPSFLSAYRRSPFCSRSSVSLLFTSIALLVAPQVVHSANLIWDNDPGTAGAQDGSGIWANGAGRWLDGDVNVNWNNAANDTAVFGMGGEGGTVTLGSGVAVGGLVFNLGVTSSYVIAGGGNTLTFGTPSTIAVDTNATISAPLAGNVAVAVSGSGMLTLTGAGSSIGVLNVGLANTEGNVTVATGGGLTLAGANLGSASGSTGTLTIQGSGAVTNTADLNIGIPVGDQQGRSGGTLNLSGNATFTQSSGNINLGRYYRDAATIINQSGTSTLEASNSTLTVAGSSAGSAAYNLSGGTVSVNQLDLGLFNDSTGVFNQSGGTVNVAATGFTNGLSLGASNSSKGVYNLSGGTLNAARLLIGQGATSSGYFYQSGGVVNVSNSMELSLNTRGNGFYGMSAGVLNVAAGGVLVGDYNTTVASFNLTGGTVAMQNGTSLRSGNGTTEGTVSINQNGGDITFYSDPGFTVGGNGQVQLGAKAATYNLNAGTLTVPGIASNGSMTSTFNFNGGTLKAAGGSFAGNFMQGLTSANIYGGGAIIDTNGENLILGQALMGTTGNGVNSTAVSDGGSGYIIAPEVIFEGGSGTGATGYAQLTDGVVSRVVITNPGTGYTSAPTISFSSGTAAATATATLVNANGGLTKIGTGTLDLSGMNTYTGATTVTAGTLAVSGSISGSKAVVVSGGGTLLFGGFEDRINSTTPVTLGAGASLGLGGVLNTGGWNEGPVDGAAGSPAEMGILTLGANSIIDFTSGVGSNLLFAGLNYAPGDVVQILNWTGTIGSDNGSASNDRLLFIGLTNFTNAQLASMQFFNDSGVAFAPGATQISFNGYSELVPVPEPSTGMLLGMMLGLLGFRQRRRGGRTVKHGNA